MKFLKVSLIAIIVGSLFFSCFEDRDDNVVLASEINDFVWKGMNIFYLYKDQVPNLANDRFTSDQEYANYLNNYSTPENLFESLIYQRSTIDRFSFIVDDYIEWEQEMAGTFLSNGLEYNFYYEPGSNTQVYGIIRLVLNNSAASGLNIERGQIFDAIDGTQLTVDNLGTLLSPNSYTLNLANYNDNGTPEVSDDVIESTTGTLNLTKQPYTENPVHTTAIIDVNGEKLGYLLYNRFTPNFSSQLNDAFGEFKANNVQHLVIDLRYNPGGSVLTASYLGSMVTGQFNNQIFSKLVYNSELQQFNDNYHFVNSFDGTTINGLNLHKVYVLTTSKSASASELVINSLKAYIDVVQIGDYTYGKTQASLTIYDSPDFLSKSNINPNHTYAMQPLVANSINVNDQAIPGNGLTPNIELLESPRNYGILGDPSERLLAAAISDIMGTGRNASPSVKYNLVQKDFNLKPFEDDMYIDSEHAPTVLRK